MTPVTKQFSTELTLDPEAILTVTSNYEIAAAILTDEIERAVEDVQRDMRAWGKDQIDEVYFADMPSI